MAANGSNGMAVVTNGDSRGVGQPGKAAVPHIDDLAAYPKDINVNQSIKRLLEEAEASLRQAEFGRMLNPSNAFKAYIKAYVIAVQYIPRHQEYPFLKDLHVALFQAHQRCLRKIQDQELAFEKIKKDIVEDNLRTGVQPQATQALSLRFSTAHQSQASSVTESTPRASTQSSRSSLDQSPKVKPVIQPKPKALSGNAVSTHNRGGSTVSADQDLAARFMKLRTMTGSSPAQDPRIKTQPIPAMKPLGPREMLPPARPKANLPSIAAELPKMPDAIYSPVRTTITGGDMPGTPTSASRVLYQRPGSSASSRLPYQQTPNGDYFTSVTSTLAQQPDTGSNEVSGTVRKLAERETVTAEELYDAMKDKSCSILLIDIRSRGGFDEGHIMYSSIICIEPDLLLRGDPSANDLAESIGVYSDNEFALFERRHKYDLIIFYDQASDRLPTSRKNNEDLVINSLHRALVLLNYGHELRYTPKLLKGGLDSWVDMMGYASLQSSNPSMTKQRNALKPASQTQRRLSAYSAKPLKANEIQAWEDTIQKDIQTYHRSEQDFLRRYPSISPIQESMTSPVAAAHRLDYGSSHKNDLRSELPTPPTRPAPSVPRPSFTGYSGPDQEQDSMSQVSGKDTSANGSGAVEKQYYTGLNNPRNWCYANSTLQCLFASNDFAAEFIASTWKNHWQIPRKKGEVNDPPQLMTRIMSNLFHWMGTGDFKVMKAKTLMDYCFQVSTKSTDARFGGDNQQDADEFLDFLFTALLDETNLLRDQESNIGQPQSIKSDLDGAYRYWQSYCNYFQSIVEKYWMSVYLNTTTCAKCNTPSRSYETIRSASVGIGHGNKPISLETLLKADAYDELTDYTCNQCGKNQTAKKEGLFARLPSHLVICLKRFANPSTKSLTEVEWNLDHLDLTPYSIQGKKQSGHSETKDAEFTGPFHYECYAVVVHQGRVVNSGHYWAYVRDSRRPTDKTAWLKCNDGVVTPETFRGRANKKLFKDGNAVPYLLFFRRKNAT